MANASSGGGKKFVNKFVKLRLVAFRMLRNQKEEKVTYTHAQKKQLADTAGL